MNLEFQDKDIVEFIKKMDYNDINNLIRLIGIALSEDKK